tara:strand:- start:263 stop:526 length:264 start_codon:yes stop_codon:yes gene_type:complete
MQRNYTPNANKASMIANEIDTKKHQSINQQIDEFFSNGGTINEIEPSCSALVDKPAAPFVINAKKNAEREAAENFELEIQTEAAPCN